MGRMCTAIGALLHLQLSRWKKSKQVQPSSLFVVRVPRRVGASAVSPAAPAVQLASKGLPVANGNYNRESVSFFVCVKSQEERRDSSMPQTHTHAALTSIINNKKATAAAAAQHHQLPSRCHDGIPNINRTIHAVASPHHGSCAYFTGSGALRPLPSSELEPTSKIKPVLDNPAFLFASGVNQSFPPFLSSPTRQYFPARVHVPRVRLRRRSR